MFDNSKNTTKQELTMRFKFSHAPVALVIIMTIFGIAIIAHNNGSNEQAYGATINGALNTAGSEQGVVVDHKVSLRNLRKTNEVRVDSEHLESAAINDCVLHGRLDVLGCEVAGNVTLRNVQAHKDVNFNGTRAHAIWVNGFTNSNLDDLRITSCQVGDGHISLENLELDDECAIRDVTIEGALIIKDAIFTGPNSKLTIANTNMRALVLKNIHVSTISLEGIQVVEEIDLSGLKPGDVCRIVCDAEMAEHISQAAPGIPLVY